MALGKKTADAKIDKRRAFRIGDVAPRVGSLFCVVRKLRICWRPDIAGSEICEQRILTGPAVTVTGIALRLAALCIDAPRERQLRLVYESPARARRARLS